MGLTVVEGKDFETEVLKEKKPVVVEFSAPWCGFCRRLAPAMDMIGKKYADDIKVMQLDIDDNEEIAAKYGIDTIPTLILYKDGESSEPFVNPPSAPAVTGWLKEQGVVK